MRQRNFNRALGMVMFLLVGVVSLSSREAQAIVTMSQSEILDRAATGVGSPYWWGHSCWRSWDHG